MSVDFHHRYLLFFAEPPTRRGARPLAKGLCWHSGGVSVELEDDGVVRFRVPDVVMERCIPVRGRLKKWFPEADYYAVCSQDELIEVAGH